MTQEAVDPRLLAVARGDEPADVLLRDARVVNVFSGEILPGDVAIAGGRIAAPPGRPARGGRRSSSPAPSSPPG